MKYVRLLATVLACAAFSSEAVASCDSTACNDEYIQQFRTDAAGNVLIDTTGNESALGCTLYGGVYISLNMSDPNAQLIYATLLTAMTQEKRVNRIRIVSGSANCAISYIWMDK